MTADQRRMAQLLRERAGSGEVSADEAAQLRDAARELSDAHARQVRALAETMPAPIGHLSRYGPSLSQHQAAQRVLDAQQAPDQPPAYRAEVVQAEPNGGEPCQAEIVPADPEAGS